MQQAPEVHEYRQFSEGLPRFIVAVAVHKLIKKNLEQKAAGQYAYTAPFRQCRLGIGNELQYVWD